MSFDTNESMADELILFADNTSSLYGQKQAILKNILRKLGNGKYNPALAPKLWGYWVEAAAKQYAKENGGTWHTMFSPSVRKLAAERLAKEEHAELLVQHPELATGIGQRVSAEVKRIIRGWK